MSGPRICGRRQGFLQFPAGTSTYFIMLRKRLSKTVDVVSHYGPSVYLRLSVPVDVKEA